MQPTAGMQVLKMKEDETIWKTELAKITWIADEDRKEGGRERREKREGSGGRPGKQYDRLGRNTNWEVAKDGSSNKVAYLGDGQLNVSPYEVFARNFHEKV